MRAKTELLQAEENSTYWNDYERRSLNSTGIVWSGFAGYMQRGTVGLLHHKGNRKERDRSPPQKPIPRVVPGAAPEVMQCVIPSIPVIAAEILSGDNRHKAGVL